MQYKNTSNYAAHLYDHPDGVVKGAVQPGEMVESDIGVLDTPVMRWVQTKQGLWFKAGEIVISPLQLLPLDSGVLITVLPESPLHAPKPIEPSPLADPGRRRLTTDIVSVYSAPDGKQRIGQIGKNNYVTTLEERLGWAQVHYQNGVGWIEIKYTLDKSVKGD